MRNETTTGQISSTRIVSPRPRKTHLLLRFEFDVSVSPALSRGPVGDESSRLHLRHVVETQFAKQRFELGRQVRRRSNVVTEIPEECRVRWSLDDDGRRMGVSLVRVIIFAADAVVVGGDGSGERGAGHSFVVRVLVGGDVAPGFFVGHYFVFIDREYCIF